MYTGTDGKYTQREYALDRSTAKTTVPSGTRVLKYNNNNNNNNNNSNNGAPGWSRRNAAVPDKFRNHRALLERLCSGGEPSDGPPQASAQQQQRPLAPVRGAVGPTGPFRPANAQPRATTFRPANQPRGAAAATAYRPANAPRALRPVYTAPRAATTFHTSHFPRATTTFHTSHFPRATNTIAAAAATRPYVGPRPHCGLLPPVHHTTAVQPWLWTPGAAVAAGYPNGGGGLPCPCNNAYCVYTQPDAQTTTRPFPLSNGPVGPSVLTALVRATSPENLERPPAYKPPAHSIRNDESAANALNSGPAPPRAVGTLTVYRRQQNGMFEDIVSRRPAGKPLAEPLARPASIAGIVESAGPSDSPPPPPPPVGKDHLEPKPVSSDPTVTGGGSRAAAADDGREKKTADNGGRAVFNTSGEEENTLIGHSGMYVHVERFTTTPADKNLVWYQKCPEPNCAAISKMTLVDGVCRRAVNTAGMKHNHPLKPSKDIIYSSIPEAV